MPRPVEKQPIAMPVESSVEAETVPDAGVTTRLASLIAAAEAGDKAFEAQHVRTETAVAHSAGAEPGSDAWVEAQEAVTALESARTTVRDVAAKIDALRHDPANAAPGNRSAIDAAAARVGAIEAAQDKVVAALNARLG
jgi:hypothetical protein